MKQIYKCGDLKVVEWNGKVEFHIGDDVRLDLDWDQAGDLAAGIAASRPREVTVYVAASSAGQSVACVAEASAIEIAKSYREQGRPAGYAAVKIKLTK